MVNKKYSPILLSIAVMLTLLGIIAGFNLPNALLPPIKRPEVELFTNWPGKSAEQIEQSLIAPLERQLQGLNNLITTQSDVSQGSAITKLSFHSDADMDKIYIEVLSRVNQVPGWPTQVARPRVQNNATGNGMLATAMMHSNGVKSEKEFIAAYERHVEPALAGVEGIAWLAPSGTSAELRLDIEFDPKQLARY